LFAIVIVQSMLTFELHDHVADPPWQPPPLCLLRSEQRLHTSLIEEVRLTTNGALGSSAGLAGALGDGASEEMDSRTLWHLVKPLVRQVEDEVEDEERVLVIDDTIEEKPYTDESELVCWHYDHSKGRSVKRLV
jgi:hypothetical protein